MENNRKSQVSDARELNQSIDPRPMPIKPITNHDSHPHILRSKTKMRTILRRECCRYVARRSEPERTSNGHSAAERQVACPEVAPASTLHREPRSSV
jgi:hypothetical protein